MERRNFIKTAGTIVVASPWLSPYAQTQSFTSTEEPTSNVKETNMAVDTANL
jgi:hypothetical protein